MTQTDSSARKEVSLNVGWGLLGGMSWHRPGHPNALCLAGWMDNAASFIPLASELETLNLVALDYAGHGLSDHRPRGCQYHIEDYVFDIDAALDALGWDHCILIGHSLGTGIAISYTCANPARVKALVLLDGLGVMTEPADRLPERLARSLRSVKKPHQHRQVFEQIEDAAAVRSKYNPMHAASARLLAERALEATEGGWRWRTDARAMWVSPSYLTEDQSTALMNTIACPTMALYTDTLEAYLGERLGIRLEAIKGLNADKIGGGHHVHMDQPELLIPFMEDFLETLDTSP